MKQLLTIILITIAGCSTSVNQVTNVQLATDGYDLILTWDGANTVVVEQRAGNQAYKLIGTITGTQFKRTVSPNEIQGAPAGECQTFTMRVDGIESNTVHICNTPQLN